MRSGLMQFAGSGRGAGRSPSVHQGNLYSFAIIVTNLCAGFPSVFPRLSTCPPRLSPGLSTENFHVFSGKTDFLHRNVDLSTGVGAHPPQGLWKTRFIHSRKLMTGSLFLCHQFVTHPMSLRRIFSTKLRRTVHIFPAAICFITCKRGCPRSPLSFRHQKMPRIFSSFSIFSVCVSPQWMQWRIWSPSRSLVGSAVISHSV